MEGENELFWLTEAEVLAKLITNSHRRNVLREAKRRVADIPTTRRKNPRNLVAAIVRKLRIDI
jgi:hypothetical protein